MSPIQEEDLKTKIAVLQRDVSQVNVFVEKLDSAIEKLTDVSSSIKELLAVHDHQLDKQSLVNEEIYRLIRELREESHKEHGDLLKRVEGLEKWKYTVVGAGIVIGFIFSQIADHLQLFT